MIARTLSGLIGLTMLYTFTGWVIDPLTAAKGLDMDLLEGLGRSSQVGDFSAFFFTAGIMASLGALRNEHVWLYGPILLIGSAALFRFNAYISHGASFHSIIYAELVMTALLIICVLLMKRELNKVES
tara:strand:- start:124 stop:507 length:384 start_codon:yes stop_codon:yes gene_type:complete